MRLDIPIILIIGVCAILGYLVFTVSYLPEQEVGLYTFEYDHNDEIKLYTVLGGNHQYYFLTRNLEDSHETMMVRNEIDEELTLSVIERHADPKNDRPFELIFPPRSEEFFFMYLTIAMREAMLFGLGAIAILLITKYKPHKPFSTDTDEILDDSMTEDDFTPEEINLAQEESDWIEKEWTDDGK